MDFTKAYHQKFKVTTQWSDRWENILLYLVYQFKWNPRQRKIISNTERNVIPTIKASAVI